MYYLKLYIFDKRMIFFFLYFILIAIAFVWEMFALKPNYFAAIPLVMFDVITGESSRRAMAGARFRKQIVARSFLFRHAVSAS